MANGWKEVPLLEEHGRTALIVCYGPSLKHTLDEIRADVPYCDVYTVSGAHDFLLDNNIRIDGHIEADPRSHKGYFLTRPQRDIDYMLASACYEGLFIPLQGYEVSIWHVASSPEEDRLIQSLWPGAYMAMGTNVGQSAISLLSGVGYRRFEVYAMDCSFEAPEEVINCPTHGITPDLMHKIGYHAGEHPNENQQPYRVWVGDRPFITSGEMMQSAQDFYALKVRRPGFKINLHGDGFLKNLIHHIDSGKPLITGDRSGTGKLTLRTPTC